MKTAGKTDCGRAVVFVLLLSLLLAVWIPAGADPGDQADVDLMLAQGAVAGLGLTDAEGNALVPRKAPEVLGRGNPDAVGVEPDYRGIVGYVALQTGWEVSRFNTFEHTPWMLPVYGQENGRWVVQDAVMHKTPVLIIDQQIREERGHKYGGYLQAVRLDTMQTIWIDVVQFVTAPYWTLSLAEAVQYGYCIAVYENTSGVMPTDRKGNRGSLPEGTRVLMCEKRTARYVSPDRQNNPLAGIIFRSGEEKDSYFRTFLFFNTGDLVLTY